MICAITYMYVLKGQRGRTQEFTKSIAVHVCGSDVILDCLSSKNPVVCKSMTDGMIHCQIHCKSDIVTSDIVTNLL